MDTSFRHLKYEIMQSFIQVELSDRLNILWVSSFSHKILEMVFVQQRANFVWQLNRFL